MAQTPPRICPHCGNPVEPEQRFCAECGTTLNEASNQPTALASGEQSAATVPTSGAQLYSRPADANPIPPPPPPESLVAPLPLHQAPLQAPDTTPPVQPALAPGAYAVPDYARAPRRSPLCLIESLVLLLLLVLGGVAVYALFFHK
jgi:hypothetical protein